MQAPLGRCRTGSIAAAGIEVILHHQQQTGIFIATFKTADVMALHRIGFNGKTRPITRLVHHHFLLGCLNVRFRCIQLRVIIKRPLQRQLRRCRNHAFIRHRLHQSIDIVTDQRAQLGTLIFQVIGRGQKRATRIGQACRHLGNIRFTGQPPLSAAGNEFQNIFVVLNVVECKLGNVLGLEGFQIHTGHIQRQVFCFTDQPQPLGFRFPIQALHVGTGAKAVKNQLRQPHTDFILGQLLINFLTGPVIGPLLAHLPANGKLGQIIRRGRTLIPVHGLVTGKPFLNSGMGIDSLGHRLFQRQRADRQRCA